MEIEESHEEKTAFTYWAIGLLRIQQDEHRISRCAKNVPASSGGAHLRFALKDLLQITL